MTTTIKRARSASPHVSDADASSSEDPIPVTKTNRGFEAVPLYTCTLPPTCHVDSQSFTTLVSLSAHHESYHSFVCHAPPSVFESATPKPPHQRGYESQEECLRVFPSQILLDIHLSECHDQLRRVKEARGEKTFECLQPNCSTKFSTPKTRRRHLIDKHEYPKQYFFGVTIWGVSEVLKKGGGMIRREWKPRFDTATSSRMATTNAAEAQNASRNLSDDEDGTEMADLEGSHHSPEPHVTQSRNKQSLMQRKLMPNITGDIDELTSRLQGTSIGLVPRSVRKAAQKSSTTSAESASATSMVVVD